MFPYNKIFAVHSRVLFPKAIFATHTPLCPTTKKTNPPSKTGTCPGSRPAAHKGPTSPTGAGGAKSGSPGLVRAVHSGKVRMAFIPEEWFLFFHPKTGVSGPYIFGILLANYIVSKEIFVMEHEYYGGLSWIIIVYLGVKHLGPALASNLDAGVDEVLKEFQDERKSEIDTYEAVIKNAKDAQWRAEGQKLLMDAKKENIAMQLEAEYRERCMMVYRTVKGRMDYHLKRSQVEGRIQQKWMIGWILENVRKSITPEFEKQALDSAIRDLAAAAGRVK